MSLVFDAGAFVALERNDRAMWRSGMDDAIDAAVVALAHHEDQIITSDPGDIAALVQAAELHSDVVLT